jgi:prepilin signal peptidase PulO-like enzyme (type II secretory pathway)
MQIVIGALLGCGTGLGVWSAGRWLTQPVEVEQPQHEGSAGLGVVLWPAFLALWGGYAGWRSPGPQVLVAAVLFTGLLAALSWIDFRVRRLPNVLLLILFALGLLQALLPGQPSLAAAGLGLLVGGGLFLGLALLRPGAMGAGDVKLAAALGAMLGYPLVLPGLLCGAVAGGAAALWLLATRRAGRKDPMAYGPYLALGAWLVWIRATGLLP